MESFKEVANNKVLGIPDGNVFSWCSQMELLAISMNKTSIWIFRIDGERVYSINNKTPILDFQWSVEGEYFVCSGADRAIKVYDSNSGALLNSFQAHDSSPVSLLSWHSFSEARPNAEPNSLIALDVSKVNILRALPKLSFELSSLNQQHSVTTRRADASKQTHFDCDTPLDFLAVISENCTMSLIFKNTFVVPNILLPKGYSYLKHDMWPDFFEQVFLVKDSNNELRLIECDVNVKGSQKRKEFFKIVELTVQMVSTIKHLNEQLEAITKGAGDFISLFDRYLSNYKDSMEVSFEISNEAGLLLLHEQIVLELSDILLTGLVPDSSLDFWLNQFGTRGLQRLSTVGNAAYDFARENIFAQVILAAEKLIIILSEMQSIANSNRYFQQDSLGISTESTDQAISYLKEFINAVYDFVWSMNEEQELFNKFLNWCQIEILEKLAKKDTDPDEFFKSHPTLDFNPSLIIKYFDECLLSPVFLQKLGIDTSNNEVLVPISEKTSSLSQQLDISSEIFLNLQDGVERFVAGLFIFKEPLSIGMSATGPGIDYSIFCDKSLITAIDHSKLYLVKRDKASILNRCIEFPNRVVCNIIIDEDRILTLYEDHDGTFRLDMFELDWSLEELNYSNMKILKTSFITSHSFVPNPAFVSIACASQKSQATGIVVDETRRKYSVIEV